MGFVVDINRCTINIEDRPEILNALKPDIGPIRNTVIFPMHSFKAAFGFDFETPKASESQSGSCRIGLVQNVLYEKRTFKYAGGSQKTVEWKGDVVDSGSPTAFPFYNEPGTASRGGKSELMVPYRQVTYDQYGFRDQAGGGSTLLRSGDVSLIDQPWFKLKLRNKSGALLTDATQILTFGIWLVVLSDQQQPPQILAHTETFSLMFTCKLTAVGEASTISVPRATFKVAATKGSATSTTAFPKRGGARVVSGKSGSNPVLTETPKDTRDDAWTKLYQAL